MAASTASQWQHTREQRSVAKAEETEDEAEKALGTSASAMEHRTCGDMESMGDEGRGGGL